MGEHKGHVSFVVRASTDHDDGNKDGGSTGATPSPSTSAVRVLLRSSIFIAGIEVSDLTEGGETLQAAMARKIAEALQLEAGETLRIESVNEQSSGVKRVAINYVVV